MPEQAHIDFGPNSNRQLPSSNKTNGSVQNFHSSVSINIFKLRYITNFVLLIELKSRCHSASFEPMKSF